MCSISYSRDGLTAEGGCGHELVVVDATMVLTEPRRLREDDSTRHSLAATKNTQELNSDRPTSRPGRITLAPGYSSRDRRRRSPHRSMRVVDDEAGSMA